MLRAWSALLVLVAGAGCVAPPALQIATGFGARSGAGSPKADGPFQLRAAVHPLQVVESRLHRTVDAGVGYVLDAGKGGPRRVVHGAYGEASWIFLQGEADDFFGRLAVRGQGRVLVDGNGTVGGGGALQLTGELAGWFKPSCSSGNGVACVAAEGAIGFYVETAYGNLYGSSIWSAGLGLIVRPPALLVIVPIHK